MKDPRPQRFEQPACFRVMALMSGGVAGPTHRDRLPPSAPSLSRYGVLEVSDPSVWSRIQRLGRTGAGTRGGEPIIRIISVAFPTLSCQMSIRAVRSKDAAKMVAGLDLRSKHLG